MDDKKEQTVEETKVILKKLLDNAKIEDEMIFDHGPLIIGSRDLPPKDRFVEPTEEAEASNSG
jgi:hypothetical protein